MIDSLNEPDYEPAPIMKKALNILFIGKLFFSEPK